MLFTDVATVYNHYVDNNVDKWKRTVIKGVQWSHNKIETSVSNGTQTQTRVESVTIDFGRDYGNATYSAAKEFATSHNGWTLNNKSKLDVMVLGEVTTEISASYPLDRLFTDYQYVGTVSSVSDNRNRDFLKTIKVVLK